MADVQVSWLQLNTAESSAEVKVSWLQFDTAETQPGPGPGPEPGLPSAPSSSGGPGYRDLRLRRLLEEDEIVFLILATALNEQLLN
jgi:hypothetical protein